MTLQPRLLDRVRERLQLKHYSIRTEQSLCGLEKTIHPVPPKSIASL